MTINTKNTAFKLVSEAFALAHTEVFGLLRENRITTDWRGLHSYANTSELPSLLEKLKEQIKTNSKFNMVAWNRMVEPYLMDEVQHYQKNHNHSAFTAFELFRILKKLDYFSAAKAIERLNVFGSTHDIVRPGVYAHTSLRGHASLSFNKSNSEFTKWFAYTIRDDYRQFLALGARLCKGNARTMAWKSSNLGFNPFNVTVMNDTTFSIKIDQRNVNIEGQTRAQILAALKNIPCVKHVDVLSDTVIQVELFRIVSYEIKPESVPMENVFVKNMLYTVPKSSLKTLEVNPPVLVEMALIKQMEDHVNTITVEIGDLADEISRLSGPMEKLMAQRDKLMKALKVLKS